MARRFIIATDPLTPDQERALKDALGSAGWWHWLPNFWLVKDSAERHTVSSIRDTIKGINSGSRAMIMQIEEITWAALTKKDAKGRDMVEWLHKTWKD